MEDSFRSLVFLIFCVFFRNEKKSPFCELWAGIAQISKIQKFLVSLILWFSSWTTFRSSNWQISIWLKMQLWLKAHKTAILQRNQSFFIISMEGETNSGAKGIPQLFLNFYLLNVSRLVLCILSHSSEIKLLKIQDQILKVKPSIKLIWIPQITIMMSVWSKLTVLWLAELLRNIFVFLISNFQNFCDFFLSFLNLD